MSPPERTVNLAPLLVLAGGLVSFAIFHFLPGFGNSAGWKIWPELGGVLLMPSYVLREPGLFATVVSFLMVALLIVASPFLTGVLRKSRLCWWMAVTMSALASIAFLLLVLRQNVPSNVGIGGWFLLAAPLINLAGLLMIRRPRATNPLGERA